MENSNRVAVIMGGTSGIGLATAKRLATDGAKVVIAGRDLEKGKRAQEVLGPDALFVRADVEQAEEVHAVVDRALSEHGRLDWAVNAAAWGRFAAAPTASVEELAWRRTMSVDLTGMWLCMRAELNAMSGSGKGGAIVNVSSVNGLSATPMASAYCAAKHGVQGLSKTAALEYAAANIRINVVCPGAHRTPLLQRAFEALSPAAPERAEAMYVERIPLGRIGEPDGCAAAIAWLLSDEASYVTGAVLAVDGGLSLGAA